MRAWVCLLVLLLGCEDTRRAREERDRVDDGDGDTLAKYSSQQAALQWRRKQAQAQALRCTGSDTCLPDVTFVDLDGDAHTRASLDGKVVVFNFWASWAKPSQREIPVLVQASHDYAGQVVFFGINVEVTDRYMVTDQALMLGIDYPVVKYSDLGNTMDPPTNIPVTWIFDRHGNRVATQMGGYSESDLNQALGLALTAP